MTCYLDRYRAGEFLPVWDEIGALPYEALAPGVLADVEAVCDETMRRVKANARALVRALSGVGYVFGYYPDGTPLPAFRGALVGADPHLHRKLATLARRVAPLPPSLGAFWRHMDTLCFIGHHPSFPAHADPLVIEPIDAALAELEIWQENVSDEGIDAAGLFRLPIAPDVYHKDNVSGGDWYGIELPCSAVDPPLAGEPHHTTFVAYLRIAFAALGFPGAAERPTPLRGLTIPLLPF